MHTQLLTPSPPVAGGRAERAGRDRACSNKMFQNSNLETLCTQTAGHGTTEGTMFQNSNLETLCVWAGAASRRRRRPPSRASACGRVRCLPPCGGPGCAHGRARQGSSSGRCARVVGGGDRPARYTRTAAPRATDRCEAPPPIRGAPPSGPFRRGGAAALSQALRPAHRPPFPPHCAPRGPASLRG